MPRDALSVVIPVLDEERRIGARLEELRARPGIDEIVVVDGGSRDRTVEIVRRFPAVRCLTAARGRGPQLNAGARAATGAVLLFLHVDVTLPADAVRCVEVALARTDAVAGAFRIRTLADATPVWWAPLLRLADIRSRVTRYPYGDQALFVRRAAFERVGGYPDQPLMEDLELSRRLRRVGDIVTVPAEVLVSGRRFVARPVHALLSMWGLPLVYRAGVSPATLARWYGDPR